MPKIRVVWQPVKKCSYCTSSKGDYNKTVYASEQEARLEAKRQSREYGLRAHYRCLARNGWHVKTVTERFTRSIW